ncbi:MAG: hypothetical protein JSV25_05855 [Spirochaetota bacterium]|nr:MAG: hypothetical protein JSV25_05855 [Spirochaetota bacterium]
MTFLRRLMIMIAAFSIPVVFTFLVGCSTDQRVVKKEIEIHTNKEIGLSIKLRYVPEKELREKFGRQSNPFLSQGSVLGMNQTIVFELEAITEKNFRGPFMIELSRIELQFGNVNTDPTNQFQLISFWDFRFQKEHVYQGWSMGKVRRRTKKNLLPNEFVINRDKVVKGYLLFRGSFPRYGDAAIYIPVLREGEGMVKNFKFDFLFEGE